MHALARYSITIIYDSYSPARQDNKASKDRDCYIHIRSYNHVYDYTSSYLTAGV